MNRMLPCAACGCPILYHRPGPASAEGVVPMICEECSRKEGKIRICLVDLP